jgi:glycerol-3-phosphate dehydrogenase
MWQGNWRDKIWSELDQPWDVIVIGGGITGAGILREATGVGLRTLMVEQRDFGWGTSSRSSKLVHGGPRYLGQGKLLLTHSLVRERNRLLNDGPGLIDPLDVLVPIYGSKFPRKWIYGFGLSIYGLLELKWRHRYHSVSDTQNLVPHIAHDGLMGAYSYSDAQTDDARLVLRVIQEAVSAGGVAINYVNADRLLQKDGRVIGVRLKDSVEERCIDTKAKVVINATGTWADNLRENIGKRRRIRPLRGSHLVISGKRLPVAHEVTIRHPVDRRYVYVLPWEGVTLVGSTDIDHRLRKDEEPTITTKEVTYLMEGLDALFPSFSLNQNDIIATFSGVRGVVGTGKIEPSKESREHVVWKENGLLTVTGGKLTNFRLIAVDALKAVRHRFSDIPALNKKMSALNPVQLDRSDFEHLDEATRLRLIGRYSVDAPAVVMQAQPGDLEFIPGTHILWAELRWGARNEGVVHLEDLLLRRVRLGILLPQGGATLLPQIRALCQSELNWNDARWEVEQGAYLALYRKSYSLPDNLRLTRKKDQ